MKKDNIQITRLLRITTGLIITFVILVQIYTIIQKKAFWLDEWFILYNIKFLNYSELFDNLLLMQQFPRVYLVILKFVAEISNYNYTALRFIPTIIQLINIIFIVFVIRKIVFPKNDFKGLLFILFFLSFQTTIFYFTQIKQYSMEMFFSLLSVYFYYYLSRNYKQIKIISFPYLFILLGIFLGSFFSYTFPITITPLLFSLFVTVIYNFINKEIKIKPLIPLLIFITALIINYFTDLQYVLNSKGHYDYFNEYIMNFDSISSILKSFYNIIRVFAYNFTFTPVHYHISFVIFLTLVGFIVTVYKQIRKLRSDNKQYIKSITFLENPNIAIYILLLLIITLTLYFLKMIPLGRPRVTYFSYIFTAYFLITGLFAVIKKVKYSKYLLVTIVIFATIFQITKEYSQEIKNENLLFDQKIYENVGNAQNYNLPIVVNTNEFYPASIAQKQENLVIKAHHLYKADKPINIYITEKDDFKKMQDSLDIEKYIKLNKYNFKIQ